jgi:hypothetical protein
VDYCKHTRERMRERFRINLTDIEYHLLCQSITEEGSHDTKKPRIKKKIINYKGKLMWVVFNRKHTIITVMTVKNLHQ